MASTSGPSSGARSTDPKRFGSECLDSDLDPILEFDLNGNAVKSFGGGMFIWPHGLDVDREGNVWVTDAVAPKKTPPGRRGHQVVKFSSSGKLLLTLGTPGVAGDGPDKLNSPSDVVVATNGDIFVADSHSFDAGNNRVVKYSKDGKFIKSWGKTGYAPGEFRMIHSIAIDLQGRVFVADRWQQPDSDFRSGGEIPCPVDAVRAAERNQLRRERPDLRRSANSNPSRRHRIDSTPFGDFLEVTKRIGNRIK